MGAIFISYRRDDTEGHAGRLFEALREAFGADKVFMDVATIAPGVDFRKVIEKNTAACSVLLALIGRDWLSVLDASGRPRLLDPNDFVRLETASALRRDIPVIPVLVQGARMPRAEDLPDDLRELVFRNSVELTHARWESDVQLLVKALGPLVSAPSVTAATPDAAAPGSASAAQPAAASSRARPRWIFPAAGAIVALLAGATGIALWRGGNGGTGLAAGPAASAAVAPPAAPASTEADRSDAAQDAAAKAAAEATAAAAAAAAKASADREAAQRLQTERALQTQRHRNGECISGYVWRAARPDDKVCVTPIVRAQTAGENTSPASRVQPGGGAYGPNTCRPGLVWREAYPGDLVCVTPASRSQAAADNAAAASRIVPLPS